MRLDLWHKGNRRRRIKKYAGENVKTVKKDFINNKSDK